MEICTDLLMHNQKHLHTCRIRLTRGGIISIRPNMISLQHRQALADEISPGLYRQYPFQVVHYEPILHVLLSDLAAAGANCGYGYMVPR